MGWFRYSCCLSGCTESSKGHCTALFLFRRTPTMSGGFPVRNCQHFLPNLRTNYCCRTEKQRSQGGSKGCADHLCAELYLSQSNPPESLASNKLTQLVPVLWMASATVYLVLPSAHLSIFAILRSDWRKRCSRLSDKNKGAWRTLEERETGVTHNNPTVLAAFVQISSWIKSLSPDEWTYFSKNFCKPFILCKTWPVFLRLKNGFQGGSLGISLGINIEKTQLVKNKIQKRH